MRCPKLSGSVQSISGVSCAAADCIWICFWDTVMTECGGIQVKMPRIKGACWALTDEQMSGR